MALFVVITEEGRSWVHGRPMRDQAEWKEHADFMNALAEERLVLVGGPLHGGARHRALLIAQSSDAATLRARLEADPWMQHGLLRFVDLSPWEVLLGDAPT